MARDVGPARTGSTGAGSLPAVGVEPALQLGEYLVWGELARDLIAVEPARQVARLVLRFAGVVDPQDRIAAVALAEAQGGGQVVEGVDEDRYEGRAGLRDPGVAERTAREVLAAPSAGVLAEVDP